MFIDASRVCSTHAASEHCRPSSWTETEPRWFRLTYVRQSLVLFHQGVVSLQQRLLNGVEIVLKLLHPLLKVVNLLLALGYAQQKKRKGRVSKALSVVAGIGWRGGPTHGLQGLLLLVQLIVGAGELLLNLVELILDLLHLLLDTANLLLSLAEKTVCVSCARERMGGFCGGDLRWPEPCPFRRRCCWR